MAEMKIVVQKIDKIEEHPNADRLEIAYTDIFDWPVIIGKDSFKINDKVIHFPVDCVINDKMESILLGNSKIKLKNGRIRAAKIRGIVSYGILSPLKELKKTFSIPEKSEDLIDILGCKKYEPPKKETNTNSDKGKKSWKRQNRNFSKYFNMNHLQNCKGIFGDDDIVVITEKLHGTSFRAGWVKRDIVGWWSKIKHYFNLSPDKDWEFVYGSRNVQLQNNKYDKSNYKKIVDKYDLKKKLPKGIVIYGEVVGPGIQKNYQYTEDHEIFVYDIKKNEIYVDFYERIGYIDALHLESVPVLAVGFYWKDIKDKLHEYYDSGSDLDIDQKVMEGIVVESKTEEICKYGRKKVKVINPEYLLNKTNTDYH